MTDVIYIYIYLTLKLDVNALTDTSLCCSVLVRFSIIVLNEFLCLPFYFYFVRWGWGVGAAGDSNISVDNFLSFFLAPVSTTLPVPMSI